jgi:hypothetical protein
VNGRTFDAQVVLTEKSSLRGELMTQYVCVRITSLRGVDLNLFQFDGHNALYYFMMNADEQIYMRYGGRDSKSASTYLNLFSLEVALAQGLELHAQHLKSGPQEQATQKAEPLYARDIPLLKARTIDRGRCVECHLVDDYRAQHMERDGTLDKLAVMYCSPDIKKIGIDLDRLKGLIVKKTSRAVAQAGMKPGDRILAINGRPVWTFGDLQFYYNKTPRDASNIQIEVGRPGGKQELVVRLPHQWWRTELVYRHWTIEPQVRFRARPLTEDEKGEHGLPATSFASMVTGIDRRAGRSKHNRLEEGDIIVAVDGAGEDSVADSADLYIKLRKTAGDTVTLSVLRNGKTMEVDLKTGRQHFRK